MSWQIQPYECVQTSEATRDVDKHRKEIPYWITGHFGPVKSNTKTVTQVRKVDWAAALIQFTSIRFIQPTRSV